MGRAPQGPAVRSEARPKQTRLKTAECIENSEEKCQKAHLRGTRWHSPQSVCHKFFSQSL